MANNEFGLPDRTINELTDYFKQNPYIELVKIFGSRSIGTYRNGSDIDLAVWLKEGGKISAIKWDLEELPTPYSFDIIDYKNLDNQKLKENIDKYGKIFFKIS